MEIKELGNSDLKVSTICLGTMTYGEQNTESEAHEQMDYALERGVNFFDTAELYAVPSRAEIQGLTEKYIGTWFQRTGKRSQVILGTKITGPSPNLNFIRPDLGYDRIQLIETIEKNLSRLKTDYIDLYQLHWPERKANFFGKLGYDHVEDGWEDNFLEIIQTMNELIDQGKIRYWGISNETPWGLMNYLRKADENNLQKCISIQNPYNFLNRSFEVGLAEISIRENIPLLAYSPLAFGLLSGKYHAGSEREDARLKKYEQMSRYNSTECWDATQKYIDIAKQNDLTPAQLGLAFVNSRPFLGANIIGATTMAQLKENIATHNIKLSAETIKSIEDVHKKYPNPAP